MSRKTIGGLSEEQVHILGQARSKKTASIDETIPLQVQTQKKVTLLALRQHRSTIDELIESIEKAQTSEEVLSSINTAAHNMVLQW